MSRPPRRPASWGRRGPEERSTGPAPGGGEAAEAAGRAPSGAASGSASAPAHPRQRRLTTVEEVSAGGLVVDRAAPRPQAALIGRHDRRGRLLWSLPKGHLEEGETARQAAVREVAEETGIRGRVLAELGTLDFWFVAEGRRVHKTVHHYLLEACGGTLSDEDREVDAVEWVPLEELPYRLAYAGERRLAQTATRLLAEAG